MPLLCKFLQLNSALLHNVAFCESEVSSIFAKIVAYLLWIIAVLRMVFVSVFHRFLNEFSLPTRQVVRILGCWLCSCSMNYAQRAEHLSHKKKWNLFVLNFYSILFSFESVAKHISTILFTSEQWKFFYFCLVRRITHNFDKWNTLFGYDSASKELRVHKMKHENTVTYVNVKGIKWNANGIQRSVLEMWKLQKLLAIMKLLAETLVFILKKSCIAKQKKSFFYLQHKSKAKHKNCDSVAAIICVAWNVLNEWVIRTNSQNSRE